MSTFDQKNQKTSYGFLPLVYFDRFLRLENYNWKNFSKNVVVTTTSWMTSKSNFSLSFHQVFAPLATSESSTSSSLRPQNHNKHQLDPEGIRAPQRPLPKALFYPSRGRGDTAPDRPGIGWGRAGLGVLWSACVCWAAQLQLPATAVFPLTPQGWTTSSSSFPTENNAANHLWLIAHLSSAMRSFSRSRWATLPSEK